jgi:hypothetical protein
MFAVVAGRIVSKDCSERPGAPRRAKEMLESLREDMQAAPFVSGEYDPRLIVVEGRLAHWTGESGERCAAVAILERLLPRARSALSENYRKLTIEHNLAHWIGQCGDSRAARRRLETVLDREMLVLGPHHPRTFVTRRRLAYYCAKTGDIGEAIDRLDGLLSDQIRELGKSHPSTLRTRRQLARWKAVEGVPAEACVLLRDLLREQDQVLGPSHPDTLNTRCDLLLITFQWRPPGIEAVRGELERLHDDQTRFLGPDHPATLRTRDVLASRDWWVSGLLGSVDRDLRVQSQRDSELGAGARVNHEAFDGLEPLRKWDGSSG